MKRRFLCLVLLESETEGFSLRSVDGYCFMRVERMDFIGAILSCLTPD